MSKGSKTRRVVLIFGGLVLASGLGAGTGAKAHAASAVTAAVEAQERASRGRALYDIGHFEEAIAEFEAAYQLTEEPALLYNLAQCHRRLEHAREAIALYRRYLTLAPGVPNRREIEERISDLERSLGPPEELAERTLSPRAPSTPWVPRAAAPSPPPRLPAPSRDPGFHTHDGWFLRLLVGLHRVSVNERRAGASRVGAGVASGVAFGYALLPSLAAFGEVGVAARSETTGPTNESRTTVGGVGAGLTYYVLPYNVYVSASLLYGIMEFSTETTVAGVTTTRESSSTSGVGTHLSLGKEWWASANWGVGVALDLYAVEAEVEGSTWAGTSGGVAFSATFN
ncbi:MAG: tetratricopeptide repeat protein [Myxococcales bacterium]|nr:tetratricopeptide repeat protein [Myxococcales bacterium]